MILALGLLGLTLQFWPTLRSGFQQVMGDLGDSRFINYLLEHSLRWLEREPAHAQFWNPPFFYPLKNVLAWSDVMVGVAPLYWVWRLGLAPESAYQAWMITCATLNYVSAVALLRSGLRFRLGASAGGAFLLSFSSSRVAELNHLQLLPNFYCFLAALALVKFAQSDSEPRRRAWLGLFFSGIVAQTYSGFYVAWFFCFGLALFGIAALFQRELRGRSIRLLRCHWLAILVSATASVLVLTPLLRHALAAATTVGWRDWQVAQNFLPRGMSWFYMGPRSWLFGWQDSLAIFQAQPVRDETTLGIGILTPALSLAGLLAVRSRPWARALLISSALVLVLLTAWPTGIHPWHAVFSWLPTASALRAVARGGLVLLIPAAIGLAVTIERRRSPWMAMAIIAVCIAEQVSTMTSYDKSDAQRRAAAAAGQVAKSCQSFYLSQPPSLEPGVFLQIDAMAASTLLGKPTVNGYTGNFPADFTNLIDPKVWRPEDVQRLQEGVARWSQDHSLEAGEVCIVGPAAPPR